VLGESAPPPGQSEAHAEPAASEAGLPKRDMTPEELEELTALVQERIAEQYGSVDNLLDQLVGAPDATDQTVQPPLTTSAKAGDQTVQPPLTTRAQTNDGSNSNATGDGGNSGSSQLEKFARRQSKAQRTPGSPKPEVPKPGKQNKQVFTSFADLQKNFPVGTTDTDDAGGKSRNAEKHNRNAQSRRRDQEKQDRRFGDDDDDG
jgi:hypothetical protein